MDAKVKILLVDDEPRNLTALKTILEPLNYLLICAQTADEALLAILKHEFAVIVLDIKMPGTSGLELAQLIKQRKSSKQVPILFLTAYSLDERDVLEAYGVGGVDFLSKPINPDILRSKIGVFADLFRTTRALTSTIETLNAEIEERQQAQEELRAMKDRLESRVVERTAELESANREIYDNEERLKMALAVAQVATWEWDLTTNKMHWSSDPETLFGFPAGSFGPDCRMSQVVHPDDTTLLDAAFERALSGGEYDVEYRVARPNGEVVWIADRGRLERDSSGNPKRIVGVSVDFTRRKVLEEALLESDRRKDEFLATLAHELRNPLAPIRYAVKMLDMKIPEQSELRQATQLIDRQIQYMARLVDDLLDVNRISRNTLALRKSVVELSGVIDAAIDSSRPAIEQNFQELIVHGPDAPVLLQADAVRLVQVLSNLLSNASKYSKLPHGSGKIWLSFAQEGDEAVISVRDGGIGIPADMLPKIFEMFTQASRSIGQSEGGLGIGLALSKKLVEMHGGRIEAKSDGLGKGSEFTVRLPTYGNAHRVMDVADSPPASEHARRRWRILIADDNPVILHFFRMLLETRGHQVETAVDGHEVLAKAEEFRPEVIALDLGMPNLDGLEAARRIRQLAWARDIALVAITGWGGESDKHRSLAAGFNAHLVKPIDVTDFENALDMIDEGRSMREIC